MATGIIYPGLTVPTASGVSADRAWKQRQPEVTWNIAPNSLNTGWTAPEPYQAAWFDPSRFISTRPTITDPKDLAFPDLAAPKSGRVNFGTFNLNLVDLRSSLSQWAGQSMGGLPQAAVGGSGFDPGGWMTSHGFDGWNIPSRLADPILGIPMALLNIGSSPKTEQASFAGRGGISNDTMPGDTNFFAWKKLPEYWGMIRSAKSEAELRQYADYVAQQNSSPGTPRAAMAEQLYQQFAKDWETWRSYSSGNERYDYLAKKGLEYIIEAGPSVLAAQQNTEAGLANALKVLEATANVGIGALDWLAGAAVSLLPIVGTPLAEFLDPVSAEAEAGWRKLSAEQRNDMFVKAGYATIAADIYVSLPMMAGWGAVMNGIRAGAQAARGAAFSEELLRNGAATSAFMRNSQHLLYTVGYRFPTTYYGYGRLLDYTNKAMALGVGLWGGLWALETAAPVVAGTQDNPVSSFVERVNSMHPVSDSVMAAGINTIGIFSSGTYGAATLGRGVYNGVRPVLGRAVGMAERPSYTALVGGGRVSGALSRVMKDNAGVPLRQSVFENDFKVWWGRTVHNLLLDDELGFLTPVVAGRAQTELGMLSTRSQDIVLNIASLMKQAEEALPAGASQVVKDSRAALLKFSREVERRVVTEMKREYGLFWSRKLGGVETVEGFSDYIVRQAERLGYTVDEAALAKELGGDINRWREAAQAMYNRGYSTRHAQMDWSARQPGAGLAAAEEADDLVLMRADQLWFDQGVAFRELHAAYLADPTTVTEEMVRAHMKRLISNTTTGSEWWSRLRKSGDYGEVTLDSLKFSTFLNWLDRELVPGGLPTRRLLGLDPATQDLPLNQFHRGLQAEGLWEIGYKAHGASDEGLRRSFLRSDWERQSNLFSAWQAERAVLEAEHLHYIDAYFKPMLDMRIHQQQAPGIIASLRYAMEAQGETPEAIAAAIRKTNRQLAGERGRMTQLQNRLGPQAEAARNAWQAFHDAPVPWRRSGEYAPAGFEVDPAKIPEIARLMNIGQISDPMMVHVTPAGPSVVAKGLLSNRELDNLGVLGRGLGGARSTETSFTVEGAFADEFQQRFVMAVRAARNEVEWDEMVNWLADRWEANDPDQLFNMLNSIDNARLPSISPHGASHPDTHIQTWKIAEPLRAGDIGMDEALARLTARLEEMTALAPGRAGEYKYNLFKYAEEGLANAPEGLHFNFVEEWEKIAVHDPANVRAFRLSYMPEDIVADSGDVFAAARPGVDAQSLEIAAGSKRLFAHTQPYDAPIEDFSLPAYDRRIETVPVSYVRDHSGRMLQAPFYEWSSTSVPGIALGNRTILGRKMDAVLQSFSNWKMVDYQRGQMARRLLPYDGIVPEQIDVFLSRLYQLAREPWSPFGPDAAKHRIFQGVPLTPQAAAHLRHADVKALGESIFGKGPFKNKATGMLEELDWATVTYQTMRQAAHLNLTASITGRAKAASVGGVGHASAWFADYLIPTLRFYLSPIFKVSERVESWAFDAMRGTQKVTDEELKAWSTAGVKVSDDALVHELGFEQYAQGLLTQPAGQRMSSAFRPDPLSQVGSMYDLPFGPFALENQIHYLTEARSRTVRGTLNRLGEAAMDPLAYKSRKQVELTIQLLRQEVPLLLKQYEPKAYQLIHDVLGVPDDQIARFIVEDRMLYQRWLNGAAGIDEVINHSTRYKPDALPVMEERGITWPLLYQTEEWQTIEALMRMHGKATQSEAFSVHYFGVYRNALERSLNHPMLGVYPLSWSLKAAREWVRFLYMNRTFGDGALRLGMAPAVAISNINQRMDELWARRPDSAEKWEDWLYSGPLGDMSFMFQLMLPGDWGSIPFPLSRPIREAIRGHLNPFDIAGRTFFGPENTGGIGVIRDGNLMWRIGGDIWSAIMATGGWDEKDESRWVRFAELASDPEKVYTPADWADYTEYPTFSLYGNP